MEKLQIEAKKYTSDAPPEIIELIRARVSTSNDIIIVKEIPKPSPFSVTLIFEEISKYAAGYDQCGLLIDIQGTTPPDAETRRVINKEFKRALSNVKHVSFVSGKNFIINTAARFAIFQTKLDSFTISKTMEEGIQHINRVLNGSTN